MAGASQGPDRRPQPCSSPRQRWREYEARKRAWLNHHPQASPEEVERAMRRIAEELEV